MIEFDNILNLNTESMRDYFILSKDSELIGFYNDNEPYEQRQHF